MMKDLRRKVKLHYLVFALCLCTAFVAQGQNTVVVNGTVTSSSDGSTLPGVNVLVKGTAQGTTTDSDGKYSLSVPDNNAVLVFSFIGFVSKEIAVGSQTTVDIVMEDDARQLGEVVVTAFGIEREKKALGYSVASVNSEAITAAGNTNFASALYGKAPGVRISTAPGGATSAVNVQVRGINSIKSQNNQPLYVVDGVMIRNIEQSSGGSVNNDGYWSDQKIRGNGILDINPADIDNLVVLKGASAAALYGSEASNGVIVITTKNGSKAKGLGVDFNYNFSVEQVAFLPKYQNTYGPGYDRATNILNGATEDGGFIPVDTDGDGSVDGVRPYFRAYGQFGPKMDGREVVWWDGTKRSYSAQPNNYKDFYQTGHTSNFNIAVSGHSDKATYRLSFTRLDYKSIAPGANSERNSFNLNTSLKLNSRVSADVVINYVNGHVHNRPESINRLTANYGGFFSRADYMDVYQNKYQTSTGFKYVLYNQTNRNPEEAIKYNIRATDLLEYLWRNVRNNDDEYQDRLISSVTLNYEIAKGLKFRGRVGNDFTSTRNQIEQFNEYPIAFNSGASSTGSYSVSQGRYSILYSDAFLTYSKDLSPSFKLAVMGGVQTKTQNYIDQSSGTTNGLVDENWFALSNSTGILSTSSNRTKATMYAYLGTLNLSFKEYLYLEATGRQEYTSTLPPKNNAYFYPSVNAGFIFTDAFQLPQFFSFGKVRASYAQIANGTTPYRSNVSYAQTTLQTVNGPVTKLGASREYGNNELKPERKKEIELGLDLRVLQNKIGLDFTYYSNTISDQILDLSLPQSTGATSVIANLGELASKGVELGISATPFESGAVRWDTRLNFANSVTKVNSLAPGMTEYTTYNLDAGAVLIKAEPGQTIGNIYAHPRQQDANGNFIVDDDPTSDYYGLYKLSADYTKVGNVQPKAVGGWSNTISYKAFSLNFLLDYRFGGSLVSAPLLYAYGVGMYESTMEHRDEANGGLPYNIVNNVKVLAANHASAEFHDGVLLDGVKSGDGTANNIVVDAATYYLNSFYWASGWYEKEGIHKNDYIKMREVVLSYNLPKTIASKLRFQNIQVSLVGRNLFYVHRTLKNLDPEVAIGSNWTRQGVDEGSMAATRSYGFSIHASF
ncbi:SusC/RagA family TonB-linked outer membrane protein [Chryseolinea lacunae]|uniref:SusC/RagA family TonB-linked outer membrane protein n=1 Tax=Chryseolinea lacunae TaxID=2801331 RepID=A0ABS1KNR6_9BACT|nr:SusC/RagA family TonB-linked outer membrane protein [Chryseolinea lacunae]MBL0741115.1 SusC/RagA family TonB-linked outer membrane protein [Chryseolinea lacunae]